MKLVRLALKNIKSYLEEQIEFFEGVNFISGINGAGKTTIIEAVGYALFDSNPFAAQRQFIRKGERRGSISLVIEAADERLYRIVRVLQAGGGGSWVVYDEETGAELHELHGAQDVKNWLKESLGISRELDPARLFEDVVGISQGKFITPFLERPRERKKIFNTILQLESYREAFDKSAGLVSSLKEKIAEKEGERKALLVKVEDLEDCRERLRSNLAQAEVLRRELHEINQDLSMLQKKIEIQEKYRTDLETRERDLYVLKENLAAFNSQKESLQLQVTEAQHNKEKADQAEPGYLAYQRAKALEKELEHKRKKRDLLNLSLQDLKNEAVSLETEISSERENRRHQIKALETEQLETVQEGEKAAAAKNQAETELKRIEVWREKLWEQKAAWQHLHRFVSLAEKGRAGLAAHLDNYRQMLYQQKNLQEKLAALGDKKKLAASCQVIEQELEELRRKLSESRAKLLTLEENRSASKGGMCPFLEMPCLNVEGNLEEYFSGEIDKLLPVIEELEKNEKEASLRAASAKQALEEYYQWQHINEQSEELGHTLAEALSALKREQKTLLGELSEDKIAPVQDSLTEAEKILRQVEGMDDKLESSVRDLTGLLQDYTGVYNNAYSDCDRLWEEGILASLLGVLSALEAQGEYFWNRADEVISRLQRESNARLAAHESSLLTLRERYKKIDCNLHELRDERIIAVKEAELKKKKQEMAALEEKLEEYVTLEEEWRNTQESLALFEPAFMQYVQNIEGARKLESLIGHLQGVTEEEMRGRQKERELREGLARLREQYRPDRLAELRTKREKLAGEKGGKERELGHALQEAEREERQVKEKEIIAQKIHRLETELTKDKKSLSLLHLVRQTLNQSGDRIAEVYRQYLGREADAIYQQIAKENVTLSWGEDYEVKIHDSQDREGEGRTFGQLSGGEKMTAALSVRLALLKQLSGLGIGFFDEPTANLDENRRSNLARIIPDVTNDFRQLFVISHDDTFDAITENIILLQKEAGVTRVVNR